MDRSFAGQCARHLTLRCRVPNIALLELEKKFSRRRRAWRIASSSKPSLSESSSVLRPTSSLDIFALDCEGTTRDEWLFIPYHLQTTLRETDEKNLFNHHFQVTTNVSNFRMALRNLLKRRRFVVACRRDSLTIRVVFLSNSKTKTLTLTWRRSLRSSVRTHTVDDVGKRCSPRKRRRMR